MGLKPTYYATNVQFLESAEAKIVPSIMVEDWEVTLEKITRLNGDLFPGGGDTDYFDLGRKFSGR